MTKKDYEAIASVIRKQWSELTAGPDSAALITLDLTSKGIADVMEQDNPRFDRARFLAACRGEDATDSAGRKVRYSKDKSMHERMCEFTADWVETIDES